MNKRDNETVSPLYQGYIYIYILFVGHPFDIYIYIYISAILLIYIYIYIYITIPMSHRFVGHPFDQQMSDPFVFTVLCRTNGWWINLYESSNESSPVSIILENKFRPNVLSVKSPVGQVSVGQRSCRSSVCRSNVCRPNVRSRCIPWQVIFMYVYIYIYIYIWFIKISEKTSPKLRVDLERILPRLS